MKIKEKLDFFEIKRALSDLPSADLELIIKDAAYLIRRKASEETIHTIRMMSNPKVKKLIKELK